MKRIAIALAIIAVCALASPAGAKAATPPTAAQLVDKLIKAGVCTGPIRSVDAIGITKTCSYSSAGDVKVNAYTTRAKMLKGLDAARVAACAYAPFGIRQEATSFTVAKTWWANVYIAAIGVPLRAAIGGTVETYSCR